MLEQQILINKVRECSIADPAIAATMMYGSFTQGCGDQYSDVEFYIYINDNYLAGFSKQDWLNGIMPFLMFYANQFGTDVVIFQNLIRGEFHFLPVAAMDEIAGFKNMGYFPDPEAMHIYDSTGRLRELLAPLPGDIPEEMQDQRTTAAVQGFMNHWLYGHNVLMRGEAARGLEVLWLVQHYLLQMIRAGQGSTIHWENPAKDLEHEISPAYYELYRQCTSGLEPDELRKAYARSLDLAGHLLKDLPDKPEHRQAGELLSKLRSRL